MLQEHLCSVQNVVTTTSRMPYRRMSYRTHYTEINQWLDQSLAELSFSNTQLTWTEPYLSTNRMEYSEYGKRSPVGSNFELRHIIGR